MKKVPVDKTNETVSDEVVDFKAKERLSKALQPLVANNKMRSYARSIGVATNTVAKWLDCQSFPSGGNVSKVAQSLGMSLDDFNAQILEGRSAPGSSPATQAINVIHSLPPSELAEVLRALADRVEAYDRRSNKKK